MCPPCCPRRCAVLLCALLLPALTAQSPTVESPLPAAEGWNARLVHHSDAGVWYAHIDQVVDTYGAPEVIATDDKGRFLVLSVYSGKWTAHTVTPDGQWLAPSRPAEVDPRVAGRELYAGGKGGSVHQIWLEARPFGKFEVRSLEIGHAAGEEFHAVLAADLLPNRPGDELLVFGISGAVFQLEPGPGSPPGTFDMREVARLPGRVRDTVVLPTVSPTVAAVSRSGHLLRLHWGASGLGWSVIARETMGLGRIALRRDGDGAVLYVTRDDGLVLRFQQRGEAWVRRPIFAGPQGPRGIAAGRFADDPGAETVAVYGYSGQVHLLTRDSGGEDFRCATIFSGENEGHWLTTGELDGRNGTDELIATDFGGRVIQLLRPQGYGLPGAAVTSPGLRGPSAPRR